MPKLPLPNTGPAAVPQSERMMMLETTREEYINLMAKIRLRQSEKAFVPSRPPLSLKYGDKVLVFRETVKRWKPRKFVSGNENIILIAEAYGDIQLYPITKVSELKEGVIYQSQISTELIVMRRKSPQVKLGLLQFYQQDKYRLFKIWAKKRNVFRRPFR